MLGDIKGFCYLKSIEGVFIGYDKQADPEGYAEIVKDLQNAPYLRIIDIGCDDSLLVLDPKGRCLCDVRDKNSIGSWFACSDCAGVLLPPGLNFFERLVESNKRLTRVGGYGDIIRKMVIMTSLHYGKFTDDFLFACQSDTNINSNESNNL